MKQKELTDLTEEELLQEQKKIKSNNTVNGFLIGIMIGIAVYSTVKNGLGFFTFFPLFLGFIAFSNRKKNKAIENELNSRN